MNHKRLKICAMLLSALGMTGLQAQETISASGGNALGSGGTVSYSVGQVFNSIHAGTTGSVIQGVQQPYEITVVTGIQESGDIHLNCAVYPNPATDFLTLNVEGQAASNLQFLSYQLCDVSGRILAGQNLSANETNIEVKHLSPASYFLKVVQTSNNACQEIKVFKIIKK